MLQSSERKKVAIVGSGISGLAALWALKEGSDHDVYLYEADNRIGGHSNTVQWKNGKYSVGVDTGFIVLNTATYPNFINFLKHLNVPTVPTDMALSVSRDNGLFEWSGKNLSSLFCQVTNFFSLTFWRMLFDIIRFNQFTLDVLINSNENNKDESIGEYLERNGYSKAFRDGYLIPITAAVWSTSPQKCIEEFPARTLIRFLWNHHQLSTIAARPEWLTLKEGSRAYVNAVMKNVPTDHVFLNTPIQSLHNDEDSRVILHLGNGYSEAYDHVILAAHGDQALSILSSSATPHEKSILSNFETSKNEVVLHSDLSHMPKRSNAWASWNFMTFSREAKLWEDRVSLTYNMNILQHIPEKEFGNVLVTLNPLSSPDPKLVQARFKYSHPLYNSKAVAAQKELGTIQNKRGISFCGAWTRYGFHEDGFSSGILVAMDHLGTKLPFEIVGEEGSRGLPMLGWGDWVVRLIIMMVQMLVIRPLDMLVNSSRQPAALKNIH